MERFLAETMMDRINTVGYKAINYDSIIVHDSIRKRRLMGSLHAGETEPTVFARILGCGDGQLPAEYARQILAIEVSDTDKARMHDLLRRNREDRLSPGETQEMHAFAKATSLLGILKSKARRTLGVKLENRTAS
jgi:hypothetical protein